MRIKEITSQSRRDFVATMECDQCGHVVEGISGYDDANYHANVIPKVKCPECGKTAGDNYRPLTTKYQAHEVI